jgi:hypothetical protein
MVTPETWGDVLTTPLPPPLGKKGVYVLPCLVWSAQTRVKVATM